MSDTTIGARVLPLCVSKVLATPDIFKSMFPSFLGNTRRPRNVIMNATRLCSSHF